MPYPPKAISIPITPPSKGTPRGFGGGGGGGGGWHKATKVIETPKKEEGYF